MRFQNRQEAGKELAQHLVHYKKKQPVILALPRGGVVVGFEVARFLKAPLDVIMARKIGAPHQPEFGIGAIAPGGIYILDEQTVQELNIPEEAIADITQREIEEMNRRIRLYRGHRPLPNLRNKIALIVDDGLATGITARAAIRSARLEQPAKIVLAVPVAPPETLTALGPEVDEIVCLFTPQDLGAISLWYHHFEQVNDNEVVFLLNLSWEEIEKNK